jgi:hypothetical protein
MIEKYKSSLRELFQKGREDNLQGHLTNPAPPAHGLRIPISMFSITTLKMPPYEKGMR